jgi:rubrerythrin
MPALVLPERPEISPSSVEEILAAAYALERAAALRYQQLGNAMHKVGYDDVARIFEDLAAEEQQHVANVEQLSVRLIGSVPAAQIVRWVLPETFGSEESGPPALLTPYKALSVAVRCEERAFAFWSYVAAGATDVAVRAQAEAMARHELFHAAKFRIARRKAYSAERQHRARPSQDDRRDLSFEELCSMRARMEAEAASFLLAAASKLETIGDPGSAKLLRDLLGELDPGAPGQQSGAAQVPVHLQGTSTALLFDTLGVLERIADRYLDLLARSPGDPTTAELQRLSDTTTSQVARVNHRLATLEPEFMRMLYASATPITERGQKAGARDVAP